MRIGILTLICVSMLGGTASAESGWVRHRDHYVRYETDLERPQGDDSSLHVRAWWDARRDAIREAKRANDRYRQRRLRAQAQRRSPAAPVEVAPAPEPHFGVKGIICSIFGSHCNEALSVVACETGGTFNPNIVNPSSGAAGLWQLMPFHWVGKFSPFDPWVSTQYAYGLSNGGTNWGPWVCKP
jgi:hypothetical protein